MSPTYTMSAHLCKQIYASWRQTRQHPHDHPEQQPQHHPAGITNTHTPPPASSYFSRASTPEKRSMESDRGDLSPPPMARQSSSGSSSWRFGGSR